MIKETLLASAFGLLGLVTVACGSQKKDLMAGTDYVNPFIGASTNTEAAGAYHGGTLHGICSTVWDFIR